VTPERLKQLQDRAEEVRRLRAEAAGALKGVRGDLRREFGVKSSREVEAELDRLKKEMAEADADLERLGRQWDEEFGDKLGD
jgi:hypothetical protein